MPDSSDYWKPPFPVDNIVEEVIQIPAMLKRLSVGKARNLVSPEMNLCVLGFVVKASLRSRQAITSRSRGDRVRSLAYHGVYVIVVL